MIYIEKGQLNAIPDTLQERATITGAYYLFKFVPDFPENPEPIMFMAPDISGYPDRLNIFQMVEGPNGSRTGANGFVSLGHGEAHLNLMRGQYTYYVYESNVETLDVGETLGNVIKQGRMTVGLTLDDADHGQNGVQFDITA